MERYVHKVHFWSNFIFWKWSIFNWNWKERDRQNEKKIIKFDFGVKITDFLNPAECHTFCILKINISPAMVQIVQIVHLFSTGDQLIMCSNAQTSFQTSKTSSFILQNSKIHVASQLPTPDGFSTINFNGEWNVWY